LHVPEEKPEDLDGDSEIKIEPAELEMDEIFGEMEDVDEQPKKKKVKIIVIDDEKPKKKKTKL
jgi:hypothetical protein